MSIKAKVFTAQIPTFLFFKFYFIFKKQQNDSFDVEGDQKLVYHIKRI